MLGLDQQVETCESPVDSFVGEHDHFAGSSGRTGVDDMRNKPFRSGNPGTSRTNDLGHLWNGLRAICHGGDALRATRLEHLGDTRHPCRHQSCVIDLSVGTRRRNDDDIFDASHFGRDRGHQGHGRKRPLAARNVAGDGWNGPGPVAGKSPGADFM